MRLVDVMFNRESFHNTMKEFIDTTAKQTVLSLVINDNIDKEEKEKIEEYVELLGKEISWLWDGKFEEYKDVCQECLDKLYTKEEQEFLINLYAEYPWINKKGQQFPYFLYESITDFGRTIAEQAEANIKNANPSLFD